MVFFLPFVSGPLWIGLVRAAAQVLFFVLQTLPSLDPDRNTNPTRKDTLHAVWANSEILFVTVRAVPNLAVDLARHPALALGKLKK